MGVWGLTNVSGQQLFSWPISYYRPHLFKWNSEVTQRTLHSRNATLSKARYTTCCHPEIALKVESVLFACSCSAEKLFAENANAPGCWSHHGGDISIVGGNEILTFNRPFYTTACLTYYWFKGGNRIYVVLFASILEGYVRTWGEQLLPVEWDKKALWAALHPWRLE